MVQLEALLTPLGYFLWLPSRAVRGRIRGEDHVGFTTKGAQTVAVRHHTNYQKENKPFNL